MGHLGGESDGGIFARSKLLEIMENKEFDIPPPCNVGSAGSVPYMLLGDEAFPLKPFLMRPFPQRSKYSALIKRENIMLLYGTDMLCIYVLQLSKLLTIPTGSSMN